MKDIRILTYPDKLLKTRSTEILEIDSDIKQIAKDLRYVLKRVGGAGISAVQIGSGIRMFARTGNHLYDVFINPEIVWMSTFRPNLREGCLSLPWIELNVRRSFIVKVKATSLGGKPLSFTAHGFEAQVIQHEIDHLDGIMILDRISKFNKRTLKTRLKRIIRARKKV